MPSATINPAALTLLMLRCLLTVAKIIDQGLGIASKVVYKKSDWVMVGSRAKAYIPVFGGRRDDFF